MRRTDLYLFIWGLLFCSCGNSVVDLAIIKDSETLKDSDTDNLIDSDSSSLETDGTETVDSETACITAYTTVKPDSCDAPIPLDCQKLYDDVLNSPTNIGCSGNSTEPYCDFQTDGCTVNGCIKNFTVLYKFNNPMSFKRVLFQSDWHSKRPYQWEIWVGQNDNETPGDGATLIWQGYGQVEPWKCVTGEVCSVEVPDECCPQGRDELQDIVNVGDMFAKWDIANLTSTVSGTHWYVVTLSTRTPDVLILREIRTQTSNCE